MQGTITVTLPDGLILKPVEYYRWLAYYCRGLDVRVHQNGQDTRLLKWNPVTSDHDLVSPNGSTTQLFTTEDSLSKCLPLVYDAAGRYIGV